MKIESIDDLFEIGLQHIYDCEQKLVEKGLPAMAKAATTPELKNAFDQHLQETRNHVSRLDRVFAICGYEAKAKDNDIVDELTNEAKDMISAIDESPLRDAALIAGGNEVEHYEMAVYGTLVAYAQQLGRREAAELLQQTLEEEKQADAKLTQIGEQNVNPKAIREQRAA
jgi:ferritin-like metal-binding protein YciE